MKKILYLLLALMSYTLVAKDHSGITLNELSSERFTLIENNKPVDILIAADEDKGVKIAAENLSKDFERVSGNPASIINTPNNNKLIIVGTLNSQYIKALSDSKKVDVNELVDKNEKYLIEYY